MKRYNFIFIAIPFFLFTSCSKNVTYESELVQNIKTISASYGFTIAKIDETQLKNVTYADINSLFLCDKLKQLLYLNGKSSDFNLLSVKIENDISNNKLMNFGLLKFFIASNKKYGSGITRQQIINDIIQNYRIQAVNASTGNNKFSSSGIGVMDDLGTVEVTGYIPWSGISAYDWQNFLDDISAAYINPDGNFGGGYSGSGSRTLGYFQGNATVSPNGYGNTVTINDNQSFIFGWATIKFQTDAGCSLINGTQQITITGITLGGWTQDPVQTPGEYNSGTVETFSIGGTFTFGISPLSYTYHATAYITLNLVSPSSLNQYPVTVTWETP